MKKIITSLLCMAALGSVAWADTVYNSNIVNEPGLAYNKTFPLNTGTVPNQSGMRKLSAEAIYSSTTFTPGTFNDGRVSTASLTVASISGLTLSTATDQITLAPTATILAAPATNQITILSTTGISAATLTFYNGSSSNTLRGGVDWFVTNTASGTAASIASALALYTDLQVSRVSNVIYASATVSGLGGNSFRLASSSPTAISTATISFSGGHPAALTNAYLTINGTVLSQGHGWAVADTSSGTATSIATILNLISGVSASASGSVVYATATVGGTAGNAYTLTSSSPGYMAVANPTFTGGSNNATVSINGVTLTQGHEWTRVATTTGTAKAISDAIMANTSLNAIVASTWTSGGVVTSTSLAVGTATKYSLTTSTPTALTASHATYVGGQNASYTVGSPLIAIASHGFTTGLPVILSTGAATPPSPLVNQTTYYVINVDANDIELASTSTGAVAGTYITLTSSSTTGPHTMTLTPLSITGTPSFKWQASNGDCTTWVDLNVSSVTVASPYTAGATFWDFGDVNMQCIRVNAIAPTQGGLALQVIGTGKN